MATYPKGTWRPGPSSKAGYPAAVVNAAQGVVCHSMVGYLAGAMGRLDSEDRASWHFSVCQDGRVFQHYDSLAITWHCGSPGWNGRLIGIEHEGGFSPEDEPLTAVQRAASVALVRWLGNAHGFPLLRPTTLHEHNEVAPPTGATNCPSGRIPWKFYTQEDEMKSFLAWVYPSGVHFIGPNGARYIASQAIADELAKQFGPMTVALSWAAVQAIGVAP